MSAVTLGWRARASPSSCAAQAAALTLVKLAVASGRSWENCRSTLLASVAAASGHLPSQSKTCSTEEAAGVTCLQCLWKCPTHRSNVGQGRHKIGPT